MSAPPLPGGPARLIEIKILLSTLDRLEAYAASVGISRAEAVRRAVDHFLAKCA